MWTKRTLDSLDHCWYIEPDEQLCIYYYFRGKFKGKFGLERRVFLSNWTISPLSKKDTRILNSLKLQLL